jgi:hypothetical protein
MVTPCPNMAKSLMDGKHLVEEQNVGCTKARMAHLLMQI